MAATIKPNDEKNGHAISNVLILFEFAAPLPPQAFTDLRAGGALHDRLKDSLPRVVEQQQMMVKFNVGADHQMSAPPISQPGTIAGISFDRVKPNGEAAMSVNVQTNALLIVCGEYERWAKVSEEVEKYLDILTPWLLPISVSSLLLQYTDIFKVSFGAQPAKPLTDLFNRDSKYLPRGFADLNEAFHSHHGFFTTPQFGLAGKLLTNVNVNVTEIASGFDANIVTMHKYQLSNMLPFIVDGSEINPTIKPAFQYLHDQNKADFGDLLTEQAKSIIALDSIKSA